MQDGKYVVLCVDDDADITESVAMLIKADGYAVETAASAEEGLQKFKDCKPDFVLVDLMMEEVDSGVALVTEIKALGSKVPIYLLSSVGDDLYKSVSADGLGFSGVLQKPVQASVLSATLKAKLK